MKKETVMTSQSALKLQQSAADAAVPGCWKLVKGQAMTLRPRQARVLQVNAGQVWVTLDGPHTGPANDWGDLFLSAGEYLNVRRGQRVVIESRGDAANTPARFGWQPVAAPAAVSAAMNSVAACARLTGAGFAFNAKPCG
jgi:hypothetical protein